MPRRARRVPRLGRGGRARRRPRGRGVVDQALAFERADAGDRDRDLQDALAGCRRALRADAHADGDQHQGRPGRGARSSPRRPSTRAPPPPPEHGAPASTPASITIPQAAQVAGSPRRCSSAPRLGRRVALLEAGHAGPSPGAQRDRGGAACTSASCSAGGAMAVCRRGACVHARRDCRPRAPRGHRPRRPRCRSASVPGGPSCGLRRVLPRRRWPPRLREVSSGSRSDDEAPAAAHPAAWWVRRQREPAARAAKTSWTTWASPPSSGSSTRGKVVDLALAVQPARRHQLRRQHRDDAESSIPRPPGEARLVWRVSYTGPMRGGLGAARSTCSRRSSARLRAPPGRADAACSSTGPRTPPASARGRDRVDPSATTARPSAEERGRRVPRRSRCRTLVEQDGDTGQVARRRRDRLPSRGPRRRRGRLMLAAAGDPGPGGSARPRYVYRARCRTRSSPPRSNWDPSLARRLYGIDTAVALRRR